nr:hypothetical protein CFP56_69104 [Quercus suber]
MCRGLANGPIRSRRYGPESQVLHELPEEWMALPDWIVVRPGMLDCTLRSLVQLSSSSPWIRSVELSEEDGFRIRSSDEALVAAVEAVDDGEIGGYRAPLMFSEADITRSDKLEDGHEMQEIDSCSRYGCKPCQVTRCTPLSCGRAIRFA